MRVVIFYLMDVFHVVYKVICAPPPMSLVLHIKCGKLSALLVVESILGKISIGDLHDNLLFQLVVDLTRDEQNIVGAQHLLSKYMKENWQPSLLNACHTLASAFSTHNSPFQVTQMSVVVIPATVIQMHVHDTGSTNLIIQVCVSLLYCACSLATSTLVLYLESDINMWQQIRFSFALSF